MCLLVVACASRHRGAPCGVSKRCRAAVIVLTKREFRARRRRWYDGTGGLSSNEKAKDPAGTGKTLMRSSQTYCGEGHIFNLPFLCVISVLKLVRPHSPILCVRTSCFPLSRSFVRSALTKGSVQVHVRVRSSNSSDSRLKEAKERGDRLMDFSLYRQPMRLDQRGKLLCRLTSTAHPRRNPPSQKWPSGGGGGKKFRRKGRYGERQITCVGPSN